MPKGSFCLAWSPSAATHPPSAQTGSNGHISHLQQQPSEHKQLCLPPRPFVLTMATAPCLSHGPSCIISMGIGGTLLTTGAYDGVKSGCVGGLKVIIMCFRRFCFITPLCLEIQSQDNIHQDNLGCTSDIFDKQHSELNQPNMLYPWER